MAFVVLQEWNAELAALAQTHSDKCSLTENTARETSSYISSEIGENINVTTNLVNPNTFIRSVIAHWESLGDMYEYETNVFSSVEAHLYTQVSQTYFVFSLTYVHSCYSVLMFPLQLVWCSSSQVGCGVSECNIDNVKYYFMVCDFQPRYHPMPLSACVKLLWLNCCILARLLVWFDLCSLYIILSGNDYGERPYSRGVPCSHCPSNKPLCVDNLCVAGNVLLVLGKLATFVDLDNVVS